MTDVHLTAQGGTIIGMSPAQRLHEALTHAAQRHADATRLVILGDLTHRGDTAQYQALAALLQDAPWPVTLMLGNHDRRAGFEAVFGHTGFQQIAFDAPGHRVLCLDTLDEAAPDTHSGLMCPARLDWLRAELSAATDPVVILMHHHLAKTGFDGMDRIALRNSDQVTDILHNSGKVRQIINGHIHRTIQTHAGPLPVTMIKSTCHQMPLVLGEGSSSLSVNEPGGYGVLLLGPKQCILHHEDFGHPEASIWNDEGSHTP